MNIISLVLSALALAVALWTRFELRLGLGRVVLAMRAARGLGAPRPGEDPLDAIEHPSRHIPR